MVQATAPRIRQPKIIERPRLTRQLDECGARIILLVAPAGYGKTTLARQWLANKPHAWCSLTPASRDVAALALALARSTKNVVGGAGQRLERQLSLAANSAQATALLANLLIDDLVSWPENAWLAIDDYHAIMGCAECEHFVELILSNVAMNVIVTSRSQPSWSSSRARAYGLNYQLGAESLAMTDEEASQVLPDPETRALAAGWPAVVGLAASLEHFEPAKDLADSAALHAFLTEELLRSAPPRVQRTLYRVSLCPEMSLEQARRVLGVGRLAAVVDRSASLGLVLLRDGSITMHPLIRQFVQDWNLKQNPQWREEMRHIANALIRESQWDAAFTLVHRMADTDTFDVLLDEALGPMLTTGRHVTLDSWVQWAKSIGATPSAHVLLAEAELAFRRGDQYAAEVLALQAARTARGHGLVGAAWNLAGRSAHLNDRYTEAISHHRTAFACASSDQERFDAIWGELIVSWQVDPSSAGELIQRLVAHSDPSVDSQLRVTTARLHDALRQGRVLDFEDDVRAGLVLASLSRNPIVLSSFLINSARWLIMTGAYGEALPVVDQAVRLASEHRLSFALPAVLNTKAMALTGQRQWRAALRSLAAARAHAEEYDDIHNLVESDVIAMRLYLAKGEMLRALEISRSPLHRTPGPLELLEHAATCELVDAIAEDDTRVRRVTVDPIAPNGEIVTLRLTAAAIRALRQHRPHSRRLAALRTHLVASGCLDTFLLACRAYPEVLTRAVDDRSFQDFIGPILQRARDVRLAKVAGVIVSPAPKPPLTKREREVHELLAQGLTNREIARLLYIEEVTVKVHVRHILDKLGVRSRVEAATHLAN